MGVCQTLFSSAGLPSDTLPVGGVAAREAPVSRPRTTTIPAASKPAAINRKCGRGDLRSGRATSVSRSVNLTRCLESLTMPLLSRKPVAVPTQPSYLREGCDRVVEEFLNSTQEP